MRTAEYKGIDYGLGQTNIDKTTGIRYGVISQNSINPDAMDDVYTQSRDLSYESAVAEMKLRISRIECESDLAEIIEELYSRGTDPKLWAEAILLDYTTNDGQIVKPVDDEIIEYVWNEIEQTFNDYGYQSDGDHDWLYESDGYKLTNCLQSDVFVLSSPYYTMARFCSPCVPGACNLDSPCDDGEKCFCLGHDWFDDGKAPYRVFSVETNEEVTPS